MRSSTSLLSSTSPPRSPPPLRIFIVFRLTAILRMYIYICTTSCILLYVSTNTPAPSDAGAMPCSSRDSLANAPTKKQPPLQAPRSLLLRTDYGFRPGGALRPSVRWASTPAGCPPRVAAGPPHPPTSCSDCTHSIRPLLRLPPFSDPPSFPQVTGTPILPRCARSVGVQEIPVATLIQFSTPSDAPLREVVYTLSLFAPCR